LLVGVAAAVVFSAVAWGFVRARSGSLVDGAAVESKRNAEVFAHAVAGWVLSPLHQTHLLSRVIEIALEGDVVYVVISYLGNTILDERSVGWERIELPGVDATDEEPTLSLLAGALILDTVVPVGDDPESPATVRIGTHARYLEVQLRSVRLAGAVSAFGLWALALLFSTWLFLRRATARAVDVSTVTRSTGAGRMKPVQFPLTIDDRAKTAAYQNRQLPLSPKPFQLLELLIRDCDKVFNEQEIIDHVWSDSPYATASDVRQCVYRLRQKLNEIELGLGDCIANVKGFGYRFDSASLGRSSDQEILTPDGVAS
jgi:DNA-binding winged helix-turn-helix (wHTH) protein